MLWDTHMHTHFSGDSNADPAAMARSAIEKNLAGICITDHLDYDYPDEPDLFTIDFPQYEKGIRQLQADFSDYLNINFGIELGLQPHLAKKHHEILQEMDFDFVIGSSHVVHGLDPYYPAYYEGRSEHAAYIQILNPFWKTSLPFMNLMYTATLTMWFVTDRKRTKITVMTNTKMSLTRSCGSLSLTVRGSS